MSRIDYLDLNGRILRLFLTVYEEGSVTKAASRLDIGQSAVSHMLDKLRDIMGDPLFVKAGRGIVATKRAEQLIKQVRPVLLSLEALPVVADFDPLKLDGEVTIGAADMQRELLLPRLAGILRTEAPLLNLRIVNSGVFSSDPLRKRHCDLLITPAPPEGTEFIQKKLFEDRWVCFYDPATKPPLTLEQYLARPHATVVFSHNERTVIDNILADRGLERRVALRVSSFSALPGLMRNTDLVIALPKFIEKTFMKRFCTCVLPVTLPVLSFYMAWHIRENLSPSHKWLRSKLTTVAKETGL